MNRNFLLRSLLVLLFLLNASALFAQTLSVDEDKSRIETVNGDVDVHLAVNNRSNAVVKTHVELSFIAPSDATVRTEVHDETLKPGPNLLRIHMPEFLKGIPEKDRGNLPWFRLRYRLSSSNSSDVRGIASFTKLMPATFRLQLGVLPISDLTKPWTVHVFAQVPGTTKPVSGVSLTATLTITPENDDEKRTLNASGRTDALGHSTLEFRLPQNVGDADLSLTVLGKRGKEVQTVEDDTSIRSQTQIYITTDKPIYQPGQSLKMRVLAFDRDGIALQGKRLHLLVKGPDYTTIFRSDLIASRFGEAHTEWSIPENARLGRYSVAAMIGDHEEYGESTSVEVSRYDLPTFTVKTKPDRSYYLRGQDAVVEVQTDYLFGQHVPHAKVRIALDERYDQASAASAVEGEADESGHFTATVSLQHLNREFADRFFRFADLPFTAYATDPSTGRTEKRRFDLRLTRDPIHIYVGAPHALTPGLPVEFFVATQYADGSPAQCDVEISLLANEDEPEVLTTQSVRTNRFGIATVQGGSWAAFKAANGADSILPLLLKAKDNRGNAGTGKEILSLRDSATRIVTDKVAYAVGDPIHVQILSTHKDGPVVVDILRSATLLQSKVLVLTNGSAEMTFRRNDLFRGAIQMAVRYVNDSSDFSDDGETRMVHFPDERGVQVDVLPSKDSFFPGEEATVSFHLQSPQSEGKDALLGVTVVDRSVEERALADNGERARLISSSVDFADTMRDEMLRMDRTKPIPEDLKLAAAYFLNPGTSYGLRRFQDSDLGPPSYVFDDLITHRVADAKSALDRIFARDRSFPSDDQSLRAMLLESGIKPDQIVDPWDNSFRFAFDVQGSTAGLVATSSGPDKLAGTEDDFIAFQWNWPFFQRRADLLNAAIIQHNFSGTFVRDSTTLRNLMLQIGEDIDTWLDPWGNPFHYAFGITGPRFTMSISTDGPNGKSEKLPKPEWRRTIVFLRSDDYTTPVRLHLEQAAAALFRQSSKFPQTDSELLQAMSLTSTGNSGWTDPWGKRFYAVFGKASSYRDAILAGAEEEVTYNEYLNGKRVAAAIIPVTEDFEILTLRSAGPDGIPDNADDFDVARVSRMVAEQASLEPSPRAVGNFPPMSPGSGVIRGVVKDDADSLIPGVTVELFKSGSEQSRTLTDDAGVYVFEKLNPGYYDVSFELAGFLGVIVRGVPVEGRAIDLNAVLQIGLSFSAVNAEVSSVGRGIALTSLSGDTSPERESRIHHNESQASFSKMPVQTSTPHLREYFPETLVWQPALEVDRKGNAQLRFKLADNITQWRIHATASTIDGRIGVAAADIISYQPFFLEHDPPRFLTVDDQIALPVVIRSYLDKAQDLNTSITSESWFETSGSTERKSTIQAGETAHETFRFKAVTPIADGKQRVTAIGTQASDSIERLVTVRPNGREVVQLQTQIFRGSSVFEVNLSGQVIPNSSHAELKIYPDLMANITDAIENIMRRPYGCAEQQISSAYPGLILLKHQKESGGVPSDISSKAKKYLESAYSRLLGYQSEDGGFTYWGSGKGDLAVTAYAIEFLHDAGTFIEVDDGVLRKATSWLAGMQRADGSWSRFTAPALESPADTLTLTGYIVRVISNPDISKLVNPPLSASRPAARNTVGDGMSYVRMHAEQWGEPGSLASLALAALNKGDRDIAVWAIRRLEQTVHREADTSYWDLQTNTLFFGWGLPGRVESTALSVLALAAGRDATIRDEKTEELINQGLLFLFRNKDRYGVWYSTQATIRVLETMERLIGNPSVRSASKNRFDVVINDNRIDSQFVPVNIQPGVPVSLDISRYIRMGANRIEIHGSIATSATIQLIESHDVPWSESFTNSELALRLNVAFDKTDAKVGDQFTAIVNAERVGFRGYGMMLAEIGLPPGVDVDRESLDDAIADSGAAVFRYDVLPDRVILYLWPKAGGSRFKFKFRARYGIDALTPASVLYDYYSPDAKTILQPVRFKVQ